MDRGNRSKSLPVILWQTEVFPGASPEHHGKEKKKTGRAEWSSRIMEGKEKG